MACASMLRRLLASLSAVAILTATTLAVPSPGYAQQASPPFPPITKPLSSSDLTSTANLLINYINIIYFGGTAGGGGGGGSVSIPLGSGLTITPGLANANPLLATSSLFTQAYPNSYTGSHPVGAAESAGVDFFNCSTSTCTATLAQAGTTGFEAGVTYSFKNIGVNPLTITTSTSTFYGFALTGSNIILAENGSATCVSDGANWGCSGNAGPLTSPQELTVSTGAVATNAATGTVFNFTPTTATSTAVTNPTNPRDGAKLIYNVTAPASAATLAFGTAFIFTGSGCGGAQPTPSTTAGFVDTYGFIYNGALSKWNCVAASMGAH